MFFQQLPSKLCVWIYCNDCVHRRPLLLLSESVWPLPMGAVYWTTNQHLKSSPRGERSILPNFNQNILLHNYWKGTPLFRALPVFARCSGYCLISSACCFCYNGPEVVRILHLIFIYTLSIQQIMIVAIGLR